MATNHSYLPQRVGGSELSTHELALFLHNNGHDVAVMAALEKAGRVFYSNRIKSKLLHRRFPQDKALGYRVYRGWTQEGHIAYGIGEVIADFRPDVFMSQAEKPVVLATEALRNGVPAFVYLRDTAFERLLRRPSSTDGIRYLANSSFTAARFREQFDMHAKVILPLIAPERYRVESRRECVLYINPDPSKGCHIVLDLARRRPDIKFVFQQSWPLTPAYRTQLLAALAQLPNTEFHPPCLDMRQVYRHAKVLLAPSQCDEAWGRVVTEAQVSGIPAITSDRGGLPEAVGAGGIVVAHDAPLEAWEEALSRLWDHPQQYDEFAARALQSAARPELQPAQLIAALEEELQQAICTGVRLTQLQPA